MLKLLSILLISNSIVFAQQGFNLIGGLTLSKVEGDGLDFGPDPDNIKGFKVGFEQESNGMISGISYTQRGFDISSRSMSNYYYDYDYDYYDDYDYDYDYGGGMFGGEGLSMSYKINYITAYLLQPVFSGSPQFDLLAGGEVGMFLNGEAEMCFGICMKEDIDMDDWDDADGAMIDFGVLLGARYILNPQVSLNARYYIGFSDWADELEVQNRTMEFTVTYNSKGKSSSISNSQYPGGSSSHSSELSGSNKSNQSSELKKDDGHCVPPSKVYGNADIDNFLQTTFEICETLQEAKEILIEANEFSENPELYIAKRGSEEVAKLKSMVNSMIQEIPNTIIQRVIDTLKDSGSVTSAAKSVKGMDKLKAVKDVANAVKNLKQISETAPDVMDQFNSLLSKF